MDEWLDTGQWYMMIAAGLKMSPTADEGKVSRRGVTEVHSHDDSLCGYGVVGASSELHLTAHQGLSTSYHGTLGGCQPAP